MSYFGFEVCKILYLFGRVEVRYDCNSQQSFCDYWLIIGRSPLCGIHQPEQHLSSWQHTEPQDYTFGRFQWKVVRHISNWIRHAHAVFIFLIPKRWLFWTGASLNWFKVTFMILIWLRRPVPECMSKNHTGLMMALQPPPPPPKSPPPNAASTKKQFKQGDRVVLKGLTEYLFE